MDHILRDSNGRPIGKIKVLSNGNLEGRDANGRLKGKYDPKTDVMRDSNGRPVGKGNLLAALITSTLAV
jgi:hypothetical protein